MRPRRVKGSLAMADDSVRRSYAMEKSPSPAWEWKRYEAVVLEEWRALLATQPATSESDFQTFFERHPCMVPGTFGPLGLPARWPYPSARTPSPASSFSTAARSRVT